MSELQVGKGSIEYAFERATRRGYGEYCWLLFPDDVAGNKFFNWLIRKRIAERWGNEVDYFAKDAKGHNIHKTCSWKDVYTRFGGQSAFFRPGAKILDLGSGSGRATGEISFRLPKVEIVGLDIAYKSHNPKSLLKASFVGGDWKHLPFTDDTFTGILACESFPRYPSASSQETANTFKEITRVAKQGAVWRATVGHFQMLDAFFGPGTTANERMFLIYNLLKNGWEIYAHSASIIARLKNKKGT